MAVGDVVAATFLDHTSDTNQLAVVKAYGQIVEIDGTKICISSWMSADEGSWKDKDDVYTLIRAAITRIDRLMPDAETDLPNK